MTDSNKSAPFSRTDLACETDAASGRSLPGAKYTEYTVSGFEISELSVTTKEGSNATGKDVGTYYTVMTGNIRELPDETLSSLARLISSLIGKLQLPHTGKEKPSLLIAGLGNRRMTADAIGPLTVEKTVVTRDLEYSRPELFSSIGCASVSAITPGVSAETGIEAADIIRGGISASHPELLIIVDALAARSCERLASAIQISDTGICPGSGIGNSRTPIIPETVGIPVISIGIPTLVDSSTLVYDVLRRADIDIDSDSELRRVLESGRSFFVSPRDCDVLNESFASVISDAVAIFTGVS